MKNGHLHRWLHRPIVEHFTARLAPAAGAHLARRRRMLHTPQSGPQSPPSIWPFLIGLDVLQDAVEAW